MRPDHVEKASMLLPSSQYCGSVFVPLAEIISNRDANSCIVKWSVELGEFEIEFCPREVIKSQILTDFVSEWTKIQMPPPKEQPEHWLMYFDGALNLEASGSSVLLISP
jgi:hypothetical protein